VADISIEIKENYSIGRFSAMACPCEILLDSKDKSLIKSITQLAFNEAKRIETLTIILFIKLITLMAHL